MSDEQCNKCRGLENLASRYVLFKDEVYYRYRANFQCVIGNRQSRASISTLQPLSSTSAIRESNSRMGGEQANEDSARNHRIKHAKFYLHAYCTASFIIPYISFAEASRTYPRLTYNREHKRFSNVDLASPSKAAPLHRNMNKNDST